MHRAAGFVCLWTAPSHAALGNQPLFCCRAWRGVQLCDSHNVSITPAPLDSLSPPRSVVFPMLCFDDEDAELWADDPQEYIRKVGSVCYIFTSWVLLCPAVLLDDPQEYVRKVGSVC